ncbi:Hypothetical_protein [Hexamita inflata]|uniref:Hypothetical_protein n=1 Tax=Hexamita inflata TaxID=28002 RepID=A0AA86PVX8_9EUKA|nr:Hypothetical protein HINF_LOCUS35000 [Hexamita inflata]
MDSDDSFMNDTVPTQRRTIQLQTASYPKIQDSSLIPGVNFVVLENLHSVSNSDFNFRVDNLMLEGKKQFDVLLLRSVVEQFNQLLNYQQSQTKIFLTQYQAQDLQFSVNKIDEEIQKQVDNLQYANAVEMYIKYFQQSFAQVSAKQKIEFLLNKIDKTKISNKNELTHKLMCLCQQQTEIAISGHFEIITGICDFASSYQTCQRIKNYIESIRLTCLLHIVQLQTIDQPDIHFKSLIQLLNQSLCYLQNFVNAHGYKNSIFDSQRDQVFLIIQEYLETHESYYTLNQSYSFDQAFNSYHITMATIIQIFTCLYFINESRSPLTGEQNEQFIPLQEIMIKRRSVRTSISQSFSILAEDESCQQAKMSQSPKSKLYRNDGFSSDSECQNEQVLEVTINPPIIQSKIQEDIVIKQYVNYDFQNEINKIIQSQQNLIFNLTMIRKFISVINVCKTRLDVAMLLNHQKTLDLLSIYPGQSLLLEHNYKIVEVYVYNQLENVVHFLFTLLKQSNQHYTNHLYLRHLVTIGLMNTCKKQPDFKHFSQIRLQLSEYALKNYLKEQKYTHYIEILRIQSQIYQETGDWCKQIMKLIDILQHMKTQKYSNDQLVQISFEIGTTLYDNGEFDLAQEFMCYACALSTQKKVIIDERKGKKKVGQQVVNVDMPTVRRKFYEAIQNVELVEQLSRRDSDTISEISESSISQQLQFEILNRQSFDIYMKRVNCYIKLNNLYAACKILKVLLTIQSITAIQKLEMLIQLCTIYLHCQQTVCQAELETFQLLDTCLTQVYNDKEMSANAQQLIIRGYCTISQFYIHIGYVNESLLVCIALSVFNKQDVVKEQLVILFNIFKFLFGQSTTNIQQSHFNFESTLVSEIPILAQTIVQKIVQTCSQNTPDIPIMIINPKSNCILQIDSQAKAVQLFASIFQDLIKIIDENSQANIRSEIYAEYLMFTSTHNFSELKFSKIDTQYIQIMQTGGVIQIGFMYELYFDDKQKTNIPKSLQFDDSFKVQIAKDISSLLPSVTSFFTKSKLLLSYSLMLIQDGKQFDDVAKILQNIINFTYTTFMCGTLSLPVLFDSSIGQLIQLKHLYQLIIQNLMFLKPEPIYLPLFVDALNELEIQLNANMSHKWYPYSMQEKDNIENTNVEDQLQISGLPLTLSSLKTTIN